jgi:hypothetical protein
MKSIGNIAKYTGAMVDFSGTSDFYRNKTSCCFTDGRVIQKKILCYCPPIRYTLNLNTMITMQNIDDRDDFKIAQDAGAKYNLPNDVRFRIEKQMEESYIQIEKRPKESHYLARKRAEKIQLSN